MKKIAATALKTILSKMGYSVLKTELLDRIPAFAYLWTVLTDEQREYVTGLLPYSKSQYAQDLFVVSELCRRKINPFFVEFGATDGIQLSNTLMLETRLGWKGILSEPAAVWHDQLAINRRCAIDRRCVTDSTGNQIEFLEAAHPNARFGNSSPELSSIATYADSGDWASKIRIANSRRYLVNTVSLGGLLDEHNAPKDIGYLSIDTEGSEYLILKGFDFSKYSIAIITVEHNFNVETRAMIHELLSRNGYERKHESISGPDDWYVRRS